MSTLLAVPPKTSEPGRTLEDPQPRTLGFLDQTALWGNLGISLLGPVTAVYVVAPGMSFLGGVHRGRRRHADRHRRPGARERRRCPDRQAGDGAAARPVRREAVLPAHRAQRRAGARLGDLRDRGDLAGRVPAAAVARALAIHPGRGRADHADGDPPARRGTAAPPVRADRGTGSDGVPDDPAVPAAAAVLHARHLERVLARHRPGHRGVRVVDPAGRRLFAALPDTARRRSPDRSSGTA